MILCNNFGFEISGGSGSHIRHSKMTSEGKVGTVVPKHPELKIGTVNYRVLKGAASHFIAKTCLTDM